MSMSYTDTVRPASESFKSRLKTIRPLSFGLRGVLSDSRRAAPRGDYAESRGFSHTKIVNGMTAALRLKTPSSLTSDARPCDRQN